MHPQPAKQRPFNYAGANVFWGGVIFLQNFAQKGTIVCQGVLFWKGWHCAQKFHEKIMKSHENFIKIVFLYFLYSSLGRWWVQ